MKYMHIANVWLELSNHGAEWPERIIVANQYNEKTEQWIILCYLPHNHQPWVTWAHDGNVNSTYWGHYFNEDEPELALRDYLARVGKEKA